MGGCDNKKTNVIDEDIENQNGRPQIVGKEIEE